MHCIILGRKLAQGFIPHWASHPEEEGADKFNSTKKVVFTKTLEKSEWDNTVLAKGDLVDEIAKLKKQDGKDIIAYGGATFVSALIKHGLIDEFHLFINPTAIGNGMSIFKELDSKQNLILVKSTSVLRNGSCLRGGNQGKPQFGSATLERFLFGLQVWHPLQYSHLVAAPPFLLVGRTGLPRPGRCT